MIHYLQGRLVEKSPTLLIIDVGGVGYEVAITLSSYEAVGKVNDTIKILTYLHVRDDIMQLFGFATPEEREMFLHLISVSGIGPKLAQGILSGSSTKELQSHIVESDVTALAKIRGVGKKTAQRLVVDLREKLGGAAMDTESAIFNLSKVEKTVVEEAILALISLGYSRSVANEVMAKTVSEAPQLEKISIEELVKRALRNV